MTKAGRHVTLARVSPKRLTRGTLESGIVDSRALAQRVEAWFLANARDLPWRRRRNGYHALVSELMLQQTQVARVVPAFEAFIRRFPNPQALAAAEEKEVLAAWRGLGYYRRAKLL